MIEISSTLRLGQGGLSIGSALALGGASGPTSALVSIIMGQSLGDRRNTIEHATAAGAKMPVGGCTISSWGFFSTNPLHVAHWNSISSMVDLLEQTSQSPCVGMATVGLTQHDEVYTCSCAIGARTLAVLHDKNTTQNLHAAIWRVITDARAAHGSVDVMIYGVHGEADAAAGTTESDYYDQGMAYYKQAQMFIAHALEDPNYRAPVILDLPVPGTVSGQNYIGVKAAIRRVANDIENGYFMGGKYHRPCETDRTHDVAQSYVMRGEHSTRMGLQHFAGETVEEALEVVSVTWDGATEVVATFNLNAVRDASFENFGTVFTEAPDGVEWYDNGTPITINSIVYSGNTATLTLDSTPSGSLAQQELRIASQSYVSATAAWPENVAGSLIRADESPWASPLYPSYDNYRWAAPQVFDEVEAA